MTSYENTNYAKTGYLNDDFRIFHLVGDHMDEVAFHFHDFHKILIYLSGNVSYLVEGRTYDLSPGDIVFVPAGEVHRPILHDNTSYERIIIYISKDFLAMYDCNGDSLSACLMRAHEKQSHVLRVPAFSNSRLGQIALELEKSFDSSLFANELYHRTLFLEFMIQLNRIAIRNGIEYLDTTASNRKIIEIIDYVNAHLTEELSIDDLAGAFYLSRYYLMHTFKEETGFTLGNYVSTKRLLMAKDLIEGGTTVTDACYACGFHNYSTFSRAYKKQFGHSPREIKEANVLTRH